MQTIELPKGVFTYSELEVITANITLNPDNLPKGQFKVIYAGDDEDVEEGDLLTIDVDFTVRDQLIAFIFADGSSGITLSLVKLEYLPPKVSLKEIYANY